MKKKGVIVANGSFPQKAAVLEEINNAETLICCDGAISSLELLGIKPTVIIGDLDSITPKQYVKYEDIVVKRPEQTTNDLTKAVNWAIENNFEEVVIVGATGKREDHTLGNISLLSSYSKRISVQMMTDFGYFTPISKSHTFKSYKDQQVSIFALTSETKISSENLKYPLHELQLQEWWMGTLNAATANSFKITFDSGDIIVFQEY